MEFRKPQQAKKGIKILAWGDSGVGKSTFALTAPKIVSIDSDDGQSFYEDNPNIVFIANTASVKDFEESLIKIEEEMLDQIETLVVDSETVFADNMQLMFMDVVERRARRKGQNTDDANLSPREWGKIKILNKKLFALKTKLASQGVNIISIAESKPIKEKRGENFVVVGHEPDMANKSDFKYDVIIKLYTEKQADGTEKYFGIIQKDRTKTFKKGEIIENPSFQCWAAIAKKMAKLETIKIDYTQDVKKDEEMAASWDEIEKAAIDRVKEILILIKTVDEGTKAKIKNIFIELKKSGIDLSKPKTKEDAEKVIEALSEFE